MPSEAGWAQVKRSPNEEKTKKARVHEKNIFFVQSGSFFFLFVIHVLTKIDARDEEFEVYMYRNINVIEGNVENFKWSLQKKKKSVTYPFKSRRTYFRIQIHPL